MTARLTPCARDNVASSSLCAQPNARNSPLLAAAIEDAVGQLCGHRALIHLRVISRPAGTLPGRDPGLLRHDPSRHAHFGRRTHGPHPRLARWSGKQRR